MTGGWRKLHNEEPHNCTSPSIIRMVKLRMVIWTRNLGRVGLEKECIHGFGEKSNKKEST
jgi:hypothetical protein